MNTATLRTSSSSSSVGFGTRVDEWFGALLSVKPSVIAACFSSAMQASHSIGADELSSVSPEQIAKARKVMGLQS